MSKKNNLLLSSIMCSLILGMSAAPVSAETIETFNLDEMIVESSRNHKTPLPGGFNNDSSRVGLLGETEVIKAPFTVQSITEDTVSKMAMPNQDLDTVLPTCLQFARVLRRLKQTFLSVVLRPMLLLIW